MVTVLVMFTATVKGKVTMTAMTDSNLLAAPGRGMTVIIAFRVLLVRITLFPN